jgi:AcrR family transcriptional regulator
MSAMKTETTNEKLILKAAEEEFITKGYSGAKTTVIAQKAGVTHAMLHYYFRTKENLFQKVFQEKVHMIANSFEVVFDDSFPFEKIIRAFVEKHYDFIMENSGLVNFVYNEVRSSKENSVMLQKILVSKMNNIFKRFEDLISKEVMKGSIKAVKPTELFMNIITLNLSASIFFSITGELSLNRNFKFNKEHKEQRKEENVQYILHSLQV